MAGRRCGGGQWDAGRAVVPAAVAGASGWTHPGLGRASSLRTGATRTVDAGLGDDRGTCRATKRAGPWLRPARDRNLGVAKAQLPPGVTWTVAFLKSVPFVSSVIDWRASFAIDASYASGEGLFLMTPAFFAMRTVWP
jgi:hypothetical protein